MKAMTRLTLALALVSQILPLRAATKVEPTTLRPSTVLLTADRSFSGQVEQVYPNGFMRLRDDLSGDVDLVVTNATLLSGHGAHALLRRIAVGSHIHGWGAFRGGRYYVKVLTIDS